MIRHGRLWVLEFWAVWKSESEAHKNEADKNGGTVGLPTALPADTGNESFHDRTDARARAPFFHSDAATVRIWGSLPAHPRSMQSSKVRAPQSH